MAMARRLLVQLLSRQTARWAWPARLEVLGFGLELAMLEPLQLRRAQPVQLAAWEAWEAR
jgi:hypothetical protein